MDESWRSASDDALIRGLTEGHPGAQEEFVQRHWAPAFRIARAVLRNDTSAEDVVQETLANVLFRIGRGNFKLERPLLHYVGSSAYYMALRTNNATPRNTACLFEDTVAVLPGAISSLVCQEICNIIEHCLEAIPAELRSVVVLCKLEEQTQREAALSLGVSKATVGRYLKRALPVFERCIQGSEVYR